MRARNIKPGFFKNAELAECSVWARLLAPGLWMMADREGRLEDRPRQIKGELFPYDSVEIEPLLVELYQWNHIIRYEVEGRKYIQIVAFSSHQRPHVNEIASKIPKVDSTCNLGSKHFALIPDTLTTDLLNPSCPAIVVASVGFDGAKFTGILSDRLAAWTEAYPALNIPDEVSRAAAWLVANPKNRKSNYQRFLVNWFSRAQDKAPAKGAPKKDVPDWIKAQYGGG